MHGRLGKRLGALVVYALVSVWTLSAQTDGTYVGYSPYSVYGIGNLHTQGTAWSKGMGGVGIATRNKRFINTMNPASVTARDSLSFMSDFGLSGKLSYFREGDKAGYNPALNIENFVISFPMWKNTAFMAGITPLSEVGYRISDTRIDYYSTQENFYSGGNGGMYQVFAAAAITLWNRLSIGVQGMYNFGSISKSSSTSYSDDSHLSFSSGDSLQVNNVGVKLGLQYEQPLSSTHYLTVGGTYRLSTPAGGNRIHYLSKGSLNRTRTDTPISDDNIRFGDEIGAGVSIRKSDIWSAEFDYTRTSWQNSGFESVPGFSNTGMEASFASSAGQTFRAGFEITPNRNDIRYFLRRCTYRAGAYFDSSYYTVSGEHVNSVGITLGMTLPVFRWYNGVTIGLDLGRRGLASSQIKETYAGFNMSLNMFDIWFKKPRYE